MLSILLVLIYLSFISLGLPDSLLGASWPLMHQDLHVPVSYAGILSMAIAGGTILSSFFSGHIIRKFGTGLVLVVSVGMTALGLVGFALSGSFPMLMIWTIPYGLGAGSVDTALNNFVALHYKAKHMNWLHSFWGVGATLGPYIMGYVLLQGFTWNQGYLTISLLQAILFGILLFTLPIWKKAQQQSTEEAQVHHTLKLSKLFQMKGAKMALLGFFAYCALEATTGLWGATYLVKEKGIVPETAASWIAFFYLGITLGRFMSGFASAKFSNQQLIRMGQGMVLVGILVFLFPLPSMFLLIGFFLIGIGCAPIYPSMLHETPINFGREVSQSIMGIQMAAAYVGTTFMPPLFGLVADHGSLGFYPYFLAFFCIFLILMTEGLHKKLKEKKY